MDGFVTSEKFSRTKNDTERAIAVIQKKMEPLAKKLEVTSQINEL